MRARTSRAALAAALLALAPAPALAGPTEDAKVAFNVGAQSYEKGDFNNAQKAFEQAYKLAPRPGILFSLAQVHRKQYYMSKEPEHLRAAIAAYRDYLTKVQQGGRRSDAAEALVELEAIASKLDMGTAAPAPAAAPAQATQIMVMAHAPEVSISLDGAKSCEAPLVADVQPGRHHVQVSAPGYFDESRDLDVKPGQTIPLDVSLRERPAKVMIKAIEGSQISIDGRFAAAAPLSQALDVEPGHHLVSVTRNGYRAYSEEIDVAHGEDRTLTVKLDTTTQRSVSYAVIGVGAAGIVAGAVLAGVSFYHQQNAQSFDQQRSQGQLMCTTTASCNALVAGYQSDVNARDSFRMASGVAFGAGAAVGIVGLMLYAFDQPHLGAARRSDAPKPATPAPTREHTFEVTASPILGPGFYGASVGARF